MKKLVEQFLRLEFCKFLIVGVVNMALMIYYAIIAVLPDVYVLANIISYVISIFVSYLLNSRFVFRKQRKTIQMVKTYISYGITLGISSGLMYIIVVNGKSLVPTKRPFQVLCIRKN